MKHAEPIERQLQSVQSELSRSREHAISQDDFDLWRDHAVTKMFFLEISERYLSNLVEEPVVVASLEHVGGERFLEHSSPVEETAINSALRAGRNQVLETVLEYEPANLEREEIDD